MKKLSLSKLGSLTNFTSATKLSSGPSSLDSSPKNLSPKLSPVRDAHLNSINNKNFSSSSPSLLATQDVDLSTLFIHYKFPFEDVFDHSACRQEFKSHLIELQNEENLVFYEIVEEYKRMKSERNRFNTASHLMKTFLEPRSTFELNLPQKSRQECIDCFKTCNVNNCPESLFDKVASTIFLQLKTDAYPRWCTSPHFKRFIVLQVKKDKSLLNQIAIKITKNKDIDLDPISRPKWMDEIDKMSTNKQTKRSPRSTMGKMKDFMLSRPRATSAGIAYESITRSASSHVAQEKTDFDALTDFCDQVVDTDSEDESVEEDDNIYKAKYEENRTVWDRMEDEQREHDLETSTERDNNSPRVIPVDGSGNTSESDSPMISIPAIPSSNICGELANELDLANFTTPMIKPSDFEGVRQSYESNVGWIKMDTGRKEVDAYKCDESYDAFYGEAHNSLRRFKYSGTVPISIDKAMEHLGSADNETAFDSTLASAPELLAFVKQLDEKEKEEDLEEDTDGPVRSMRPLVNTSPLTPRTPEQFDESTNSHAAYITYRVHKYPWPTKDRTFITSQSAVLDDAPAYDKRKYIIFTKSTEFDNFVPRDDKIRGKIVQSIVLEEIDPMKCKYTVTSWYDMNGRFPLKSFNSVMKKQAFHFHEQLYGLVWNDTPKVVNNTSKKKPPCLYDTLDYYSLIKELNQKDLMVEKIQSMIQGLNTLAHNQFDPYKAVRADQS